MVSVRRFLQIKSDSELGSQCLTHRPLPSPVSVPSKGNYRQFPDSIISYTFLAAPAVSSAEISFSSCPTLPVPSRFSWIFFLHEAFLDSFCHELEIFLLFLFPSMPIL